MRSVQSTWPSPVSRGFRLEQLEQRELLTLGDFNEDGIFDCQDIDALVGAIAVGQNQNQFDMTRDGLVNLMDRNAWLTEAGFANLSSGNPYLVGDSTLDGVVDGSDYAIWNANKFTAQAAWCKGDFNANGTIDGSDFGLWNANRFRSSAVLISQGLGAAAYTSSGNNGQTPDLAFDGDPTTTWNSGGFPTQWIEVDLGQSRTISNMSLLTQQSPPGYTVHGIWISANPIGSNFASGKLVYTISETTTSNQLIEVRLGLREARYVQVRTVSSPSWVAWAEIKVFAPPGNAFALSPSTIDVLLTEPHPCFNDHFCFDDELDGGVSMFKGGHYIASPGTKRASARVTFDLSNVPEFDPSTAQLIVSGNWVHFSPPIADSIRVADVSLSSSDVFATAILSQPITLHIYGILDLVNSMSDDLEVMIDYFDYDGVDHLPPSGMAVELYRFSLIVSDAVTPISNAGVDTSKVVETILGDSMLTHVSLPSVLRTDATVGLNQRVFNNRVKLIEFQRSHCADTFRMKAIRTADKAAEVSRFCIEKPASALYSEHLLANSPRCKLFYQEFNVFTQEDVSFALHIGFGPPSSDEWVHTILMRSA